LKYLGPERYGLWVAISSVIMLLSFADCGVGYGLMNRVAKGIGTGDRKLIAESVSSTFFLLLLLALALLGVFGCLYPWIPWRAFFHIKNPADATAAGRAVAVMVATFLLTQPFTTVQRVQFAYQEGFQAQVWQIGGVLLSLAGIVAVINARGDLWSLALGSTGGPFIAVCLNWFLYFQYKRPSLWPRVALWNFPLARGIVTDGAYFLVLQVATTVVLSIDNLIVVQVFGPRKLTEYNLVARLFQIGPAVAGIWFAPLWPAYMEAITRGDVNWVRKMLSFSVKGAVLGSVGICVVTGLLIRPLVFLWTRTRIDPSLYLLVGFGLYSVVLTGTSAASTYLNGSNYIRGQALLVVAHAAISVILKLVLCRYLDTAGVVWGTVLSYAFVIIPAYALIVPRLLRGQERDAITEPALVTG
jgi:O-antigen/teichoic acid export membrane protein